MSMALEFVADELASLGLGGCISDAGGASQNGAVEDDDSGAL